MLVEHPQLRLLIYPVDGPRVWPFFAPSHYMSEKFHGHRSWIVVTPEGDPVAFTSIIRFPHGHLTNAWRGHRTVVLPDYQGLGIGGRLSDWTGEHVVNHMKDADGNPGRYYSRTVHPRFGAYRNASDKWRATSSNEKVGAPPNKGISATALMRWSFSHEYVGSGGNAATRKKGASRKPRGNTARGGGGRGADVSAAMPADGGSRVEVPDLYEYQEDGIEFLVLAGSAILADEMGGGKSAQAAKAIKALPALVVSPAGVMDGWRVELNKFRPDLRVQVAGSGTPKARLAIDAINSDAADVLVLNYEALPNVSRLTRFGSIALQGCENCDEFSDRKPHLCEREKGPLNHVPWGTVIADEAHRAKDPKTKWTRALWATADPAPHRYALTGTPIEKNLEDLWALARMVAPDVFGSKTKFLEMFALMELNTWSGFPKPIGIRPEMRDLFDRVLNPFYLRRTKEFMMPWLPEATSMRREASMSAKQRKAYREMEDELIAQLDSGVLMAGDPLSQFTRLKQFAAAYGQVAADGKLVLTEPSGKLDELDDALEEAGDRQVVVFTESTQLLDMAAARLDKRDALHVKVTGHVPREQRPPLIARFAEGGAQYALMSLGAGAEGINGLQVADTAVFVQRSLSSITNTQAERRILRMGQRSDKVTIVDIVTPDTVEERIEEIRGEKADALEDFVRDKEAVRAWLTR